MLPVAPTASRAQYPAMPIRSHQTAGPQLHWSAMALKVLAQAAAMGLYVPPEPSR